MISRLKKVGGEWQWETILKETTVAWFCDNLDFCEKRNRKFKKDFNQYNSRPESLSYKNVISCGRVLRVGVLLNRPLDYFGIRQCVNPMDVLLMVAVATRAGSESRAPSPASCSPITSTNILHDGPCSHLLYGPTNRRHIERHEVQGARERNWDFFPLSTTYIRTQTYS